jgi:hypothetical protein
MIILRTRKISPDHGHDPGKTPRRLVEDLDQGQIVESIIKSIEGVIEGARKEVAEIEREVAADQETTAKGTMIKYLKMELVMTWQKQL